jgi:hypothetical protein
MVMPLAFMCDGKSADCKCGRTVHKDVYCPTLNLLATLLGFWERAQQ